jgi:hypothetical protein
MYTIFVTCATSCCLGHTRLHERQFIYASDSIYRSPTNGFQRLKSYDKSQPAFVTLNGFQQKKLVVDVLTSIINIICYM